MVTVSGGSCFTISSCSYCSAQQPFFSAAAHPGLLCSHQRAFSGSSAVSSSSSSSSSMWSSPFSNTHNQIWRRNLYTCMAEPYLIAKPKSAERTYRELLKWRAAAEPKRITKEEKFELPDFFEIDKDATALNLLFESAQMLKTARHYEAVFLVDEDHVDQLPDVIQKVKDFIEENKGKIYRLNDWGMRKLAYKIRKARRANYILMNFQIDAKAINEFKLLLDKDERVIRHLVMTMKRAETVQTVPPPEFTSIRDEENLDLDDEEYDNEEELEESEVEDEEEDDGEDEKVEEEEDDVEDQKMEEAKEGELTQV